MTFRAVLTLFQFHWKALALLCLVGANLGLGAAIISPKEYSATTQLFVSVSDSQSSSDAAQGATYAQDQARNFAALATTQAVLEPVVDDVVPGSSVRALRQQVNVTVPLNTSIIAITATDDSPRRAAGISNQLASSLTDTVDGVVAPLSNGASPVRLSLVERADVPTTPSAPSVPLFVALGLILGAALWALWFGVRDYVRARVRSPEHAAEVVGAPVVGVISAEKKFDARVVSTRTSRSIRAEQYRQIRTNLRFLQMDQGRKVFVITSTIPGEAKSTTAANLAAAIAAEGTSVCLVEADLRRPTIGQVLDLESSIGMTTVLAGEADLDDVLQTWGPDGLRVLLSGELPPNPSELLGSRAVEVLLRGIQERFDITIIDCPPVLAVTDATILSRMFGGVLMVVSEHKVEVRDLRRAVERLSFTDRPVLGAVVTMSRALINGSSAYNHYYSARPSEIVAEQTEASPLPEAPEQQTVADTRAR